MESDTPSQAAVIGLRDASDLRLVGGKAFNLYRAQDAGLRVPRSFVVTTNAWRIALNYIDWLGNNHHDSSAQGGASSVISSTMSGFVQQLRQILITHGVPELVENAVVAAWEQELGSLRVAVRSSGVAEDSLSSSFAGQLESKLNLQNAEEVNQAVLACWLSGLSDRVIQYQARVGERQIPMPMAVLIQEMVTADRGGVLFSKNPVSENVSEMLISSNLGLGTTVVDGSVVPDLYIIERSTGDLLRFEIGGKQYREDVFAGGGVMRTAVPPDEQTRPSLEPGEVRELWALGRRVEDIFGTPIDLEWAYANGQFVVLQIRPITKLVRANDQHRPNRDS